jgi:hypothetical protein
MITLDLDPDCSGIEDHVEAEHPDFIKWLEDNNL